ncbi:histidine kinase [Bombilactobacillus folatiphilus]|uniref:histidine kinase n=1 Tax=Bombilactobacillus folatiphilus TaxID=2923362 RepID=A0ABY4PAF2_9LACO|nr:histidine kinase [Bombilactobacillus folatiphilus]UQS82658.1 histidine kinase [Bombilactobacillus folatiphilus]
MNKSRAFNQVFIIGGVCFILFFQQPLQPTAVMYPLISLLCSSLIMLPLKNWQYYLPLGILSILGSWHLKFWYFSPLILAMTLFKQPPISRKLVFILILMPTLIHWQWQTILIVGLNWLVLEMTTLNGKIKHLKRQILQLQDDSFEQQRQLTQQNLALTKASQTQLQLQIANERNRIARDIHDNVGHLLSSSILQVGALSALNQEPVVNESLTNLQITLNQALNSIRTNVHQLQQKAMTLSDGLTLLSKNFQFCPIKIQGTIFQLDEQSTQALLAVIKETLTNIIKHTNAKQVVLNFQNLLGFYRLQIKNDGANDNYQIGMGLTDMMERITEIGGQIHFHVHQHQFLITIILMKEQVHG